MHDQQTWQQWKDAGIWEAFLPRELVQGLPHGPVRGGFVPIDEDGHPISIDGKTVFELRTGGTIEVPTDSISFNKPGDNVQVARQKEAIRLS